MSGRPSGEESSRTDEEVNLEPDLRQAVIDLHGRLEELDYYALLGVERTIDRKAVKRAYFEAAAKFHPDRHFRKKLGPFKVKMEAIFTRLKIAHDTLADRAKRTEYDAYLQARNRSRSIEELLADALAEVRRVEENVEQQVRMSASSGAAPAPSPAPPTAVVEAREPPPASTAAKSPSPVVDDAARRDALARRLLGGQRKPSGSTATAPQASPPARPPQTTPEAMDALRRRYEDRVVHAKAAQARGYVEKAKSAIAGGDAVAAANALRVASNLAPDDADIGRMAKDAQAKANVIVGQTYTQQAEYEERHGHWSEAARSWTRACNARESDARCHERAANAILRAAGDLHEAAALGRRACELDPSNAAARITLASVYLAAGLMLNARRELDTAAQLAPHDVTMREMIKQANKTP